MPGAILHATLGSQIPGSWLAAPISAGLLFPLFHLAQLEAESALSIFSAAVWRSLLLAAPAWLAFYVESAALVSLCGVAIFGGFCLGWVGIIFVPPIAAIAALVVYFRLLGRLGWVCADRLERYYNANEAENVG